MGVQGRCWTWSLFCRGSTLLRGVIAVRVRLPPLQGAVGDLTGRGGFYRGDPQALKISTGG